MGFHANAAGSLVLAALFASPMLLAQSAQPPVVEVQPEAPATAILQGFVRDSLKRPVAEVTICLRSKDGQILTVHTDATGAYVFSAIRQGAYTLSAEKSGYAKATSVPLVIELKSKTVDLTLNPATADESKQSSAAPPEFFDEPHFNVAGVTDTTSLGGHGSDTAVRNREALAQATAALGKQAPGSSARDSSNAMTEKALRESVTRHPEDFDANFRLGKLLVDEGKPQEGLPYLENACKLNPSADLHHLLADTHEKLGDPLEAVREYQRAAELSPSEANLFDWGAELLTHHAAEPAIEVFTKGNRMFPHSVRMLAGLGAAWYSQRSFDKAAQNFCEASDLNPDDPNPYLLMGKMQAVETVHSQEIEERLERFVRLQPQNPWANYYFAVSLQKKWRSPEEIKIEDVEQVKSLLQNAIHLDPKLGLAYLQLGILDSEQKDFPQAISAYRQAIEVAPDLPEAHYRLAQAYKQAGEIAKAHTEMQLYEQISKEKMQEIERQRHELQQFVYELRDRTPASQPQ
jgi:tetratricopeptide (TPR) repeat protein